MTQFTFKNDWQIQWEAARVALAEEMQEDLSLDALTGTNGNESRSLIDDSGNAAGWLIAQRKKGHRHSADDVLTAWYALQHTPPVTRHLDLGTGIGTVGLLTLWGMGAKAQLTCVEAQEVSYRQLRVNVQANGLTNRVQTLWGDLRHFSADEKFPLITGSPPYFPEGTGVMPLDSQKAHARFELRGNVSDYAQAAARNLEPSGWFVLCFPTPQKQRALEGLDDAGFVVAFMRDVIPRDSLPALFTVFACRLRENFIGKAVVEEPLVVRHLNGKLTAEMAAVRVGFGFPERGIDEMG